MVSTIIKERGCGQKESTVEPATHVREKVQVTDENMESNKSNKSNTGFLDMCS